MANSEGGSISSGDESDMESRSQDFDYEEKKRKPGIIYLSSVPEGMNVSGTTSFFAEFGRVGRVFLQPDQKMGMRRFTEGWIEFMSKKVAKRVAEQVNSTPVGGKRKHKSHYTLWNIKYLPRFKWVHLSERLAYEKAVKQQRMRTEISQVKREAETFKGSVRLQKKKKRKRDEAEPEEAVDAADTESGRTEPDLFYFRQEPSYSGGKKRRVDEKDTEEAPMASSSKDQRQQSKPKTKKMKKEKKAKEKPSDVADVRLRVRSPPTKTKQSKKEAKKNKKNSGKKSMQDHSSADTNSNESGVHHSSAVHSQSAPKSSSSSILTATGSGSSSLSASALARQRRRSACDETGGSGRKHRSAGTAAGSSSHEGGSSTRRKSGEADRAAFLKSVFGGGT